MSDPHPVGQHRMESSPPDETRFGRSGDSPKGPGKLLIGGSLVVMVVAASTLPLLDPIDVLVYRMGADLWLDGGNQLYSTTLAPSVVGGAELPFLYPPIAAVLFVPLAVVPWQAAAILVTAVGMVALVISCGVAARSLHGRGGRALTIAFGAAAIALLLDPIRMTVVAGQINLVLMGLVVADCLLPRTRWPRGMLIGLAAAIKLTPLIFLLFFLPRRQWRPAATAVGTFLGLGLLGFALAPADSVDYWSSTFLDTGRLEDAPVPINQSIGGVLSLFGLSGAVYTALWLVLCLGVVMLAWIAVRYARGVHNDLAALLLVAVAGLLVSPISWINHWVWIAPALPLLLLGLSRAYRGPLVVAGVITVFLTFLVGTPLVTTALHSSGAPWAPWELVVGNGYVLIGLVALLVGVWTLRRTRPSLDLPRPSGPADRGGAHVSD